MVWPIQTQKQTKTAQTVGETQDVKQPESWVKEEHHKTLKNTQKLANNNNNNVWKSVKKRSGQLT